MPTSGFIRSYDATIEDVNPTRKSVVARINTSSRDRYNTVILAKGCRHKNWRAAGGPVLWEHARHDFKDIIANADRLWNNGGPNPTEIIAEPVFTEKPFAQERFRMYESGQIRGWSVNCIPAPGTYGPPTYEELRAHPDWEGVDTVYRDWELLEFSGTIVPGNAETLTTTHAAKIMSMVERGLLWMPDEAEPIYRAALGRTTVIMPGFSAEVRTMTDSTGGLAGGGVTVKPETKGEPVEINRVIVEEDGKFFVYSEDKSKRLGGPYDSRSEAEKRLEQVDYFKHKDAKRDAGDGDDDDIEAIEESGARSGPDSMLTRDTPASDSGDNVVEKDGQFYGVCKRPGCPGGPHPSRAEAMAHDCQRADPGAPPVLSGSAPEGVGRGATDADAVAFDGHGAWTVTGLPASRFNDEATATAMHRALSHRGPTLRTVVGLSLVEIRHWRDKTIADAAMDRDLYERGVV